jgi:hypothetical protein
MTTCASASPPWLTTNKMTIISYNTRSDRRETDRVLALVFDDEGRKEMQDR